METQEKEKNINEEKKFKSYYVVWKRVWKSRNTENLYRV